MGSQKLPRQEEVKKGDIDGGGFDFELKSKSNNSF